MDNSGTTKLIKLRIARPGDDNKVERKPSSKQLKNARDLLRWTTTYAEEKIFEFFSEFSKGELTRIEAGNEQKPKKSGYGTYYEFEEYPEHNSRETDLINTRHMSPGLVDFSNLDWERTISYPMTYSEMVAATYYRYGAVCCKNGSVIRVPTEALREWKEFYLWKE